MGRKSSEGMGLHFYTFAKLQPVRAAMSSEQRHSLKIKVEEQPGGPSKEDIEKILNSPDGQKALEAAFKSVTGRDDVVVESTDKAANASAGGGDPTSGSGAAGSPGGDDYQIKYGGADSSAMEASQGGGAPGADGYTYKYKYKYLYKYIYKKSDAMPAQLEEADSKAIE